MLDKDRIITTLNSKIAHAKGIDRDFIYLPVWQAKELVEYLQPMKARQTANGYFCDRCGSPLAGYYQQQYCDECGQLISWQKGEKHE